MKFKFKRIVAIVFLLLIALQNICFADLIIDDPILDDWKPGRGTKPMYEENGKIEYFYEWFVEKGGLWITLTVTIVIVIGISLFILHKISENEESTGNKEMATLKNVSDK